MTHSLKLSDYVKVNPYPGSTFRVQHFNSVGPGMLDVRLAMVPTPTILTGPNGEKYELHGDTVKPVKPDPLETLQSEFKDITNDTESSTLDLYNRLAASVGNYLRTAVH